MATLMGKHRFSHGRQVSVISDDDGAVRIVGVDASGAPLNIAVHGNRIEGVPAAWLPRPAPVRRSKPADALGRED